jgi:hypothetical protein
MSDAEFISAIEQYADSATEGINTSVPGTVVSYNAATNRAVVKPSLPRNIADDEPLDPPKIVEVPVLFHAAGGGNVSFTMPLQPGDGVMLNFQQRSIENWLNGSNQAPDDPRQFDLSDCVAIPGLSNKGVVGHADDVVLKFGSSEVRLLKDGSINIGNAGGSVHIDSGGNMILKAQSIQVQTSAKNFVLEHHKHDQVQVGGSLSGEPFPT